MSAASQRRVGGRIQVENLFRANCPRLQLRKKPHIFRQNMICNKEKAQVRKTLAKGRVVFQARGTSMAYSLLCICIYI